MPTIVVNRSLLLGKLNRPSMTDADFTDLCFQYGIELGDVTSVAAMIRSGERARASNEKVGGEEDKQVLYKIEVPANRADLLCLEGLVAALCAYLKPETPIIEPVTIDAKAPEQAVRLMVDAATTKHRPYVVAAVLRNIKFTPESYASFMDLQDKFHQNLGRQRSICAVGAHDLDTIRPPFLYAGQAPKDIRFVALFESKPLTVPELFAQYHATGNKLRAYTHLTDKAELHPIIRDADKRVLSLPPIINSDHSKVTLATKNLFIECTGTDLAKLNTVLNVICSQFSIYCSPAHYVERVSIVDAATAQCLYVTPSLEPRELEVPVAYLNERIGRVQISAKQAIAYLQQMRLSARVTRKNKNLLLVKVPVTRPDILHACDVMEDVAIAYGFNRIPKTHPASATVGIAQPLNQLTDGLRATLAEVGYMEVLTWALMRHDEAFRDLNRVDDGKTCAVIASSKCSEFEIVRPSLLGSILKTVASNSTEPLPVQIFEIGDVVRLDANMDVGARNARHLAALYADSTSGFELIHGVLDRVMDMHELVFVASARNGAKKSVSSSAPPVRPGSTSAATTVATTTVAAAAITATVASTAVASTAVARAKGAVAAATAAAITAATTAAVAIDVGPDVDADTPSILPPPTRAKGVYWIEEMESPSFVKHRQAAIWAGTTVDTARLVGEMGIVHPSVLSASRIPPTHVCSVLEMQVEFLLHL